MRRLALQRSRTSSDALIRDMKATFKSRVDASDVGVASVALSRDVLVVGDAEGVVVAFDF